MSLQLTRDARFRRVGELFISEQMANHAKTMKVLADNGLRPLTYQEALSHASELVKELRGKIFWLAGKGEARDGVFTFDENGKLKELSGNETVDQKVRVSPGECPHSMSVSYDLHSRARFNLSAFIFPIVGASVVVGVAVNLQDKQAKRD